MTPVVRRRLSKPEIRNRDEVRRWTRRGVARAVLEKHHDAHYMASHPIAMELAKSASTKTIERFATERNPAGSTGIGYFELGVSDPTHPKSAQWPKT